MTLIEDPRDRTDDILVTESQETLSPEQFQEARKSAAVTAGWVVVAFAFDEAGRVLVIDQPWADGWILPGGAWHPGETLAETAVARSARRPASRCRRSHPGRSTNSPSSTSARARLRAGRSWYD